MSEGSRPIEVTTRYSTTVPDLQSAWEFVMDRLDAVGPDPGVTIAPVWTGEDMGVRRFAVVVNGMVEEAR